MKFTVELKGITLPESVQEEISRDLNRLVMKRLGELDLDQGQATAAAAGSGGYLGLIDLINGGRILALSRELVVNLNTILSKEGGLDSHLSTGGGFQMNKSTGR